MGDLYYVVSSSGKYVGYNMKQRELYANPLQLLATFMFIETEIGIFFKDIFFIKGTDNLEYWCMANHQTLEDVSEEYLRYAKEEEE